MPSSNTDFYGHAFKPTEGKQSEIGLKYDPVGLDALFTLALFNLRETNVATRTRIMPTSACKPVRSVLAASNWTAKSTSPRHGRYWHPRAFTDPKVTSANDGTEGKHPVGISRHSAKLWTQYALSGPLDGFSLGGGVRYIGSSYATSDNSLKVPAATVYDARIGYQWREWGVALNAANLTDKTYLASCQDNGCEYAMKRQLIATVNYKW